MKKILPILLVSIMMLALVVAPVSAHRGGKVEAAYGTPEIDGKFDEWDIAEYATLKVDYQNTDKPDNKSTAQVKAMWDEEGFYFLVNAKDADLVDDDMFEFYIDEAYDKSQKYNRNDRQSRIYVKSGEIADSLTDEDGNPTARKELYVGSAYAETDEGWMMEVAFKWSGNVEIEAGKSCGLELMWDDQSTEDKNNCAIRWNVDTRAGETAPYQSSEFWGELVLLEEVIEVVEEEAPAAAETSTATADPITAALAIVAILGSGVVVSKVRK